MMNYNTSNFQPLHSSSNIMSAANNIDNNINNNIDNNNNNNNNNSNNKNSNSNNTTTIDNNNNNNTNDNNNINSNNDNNNHSNIKALNPSTSIPASINNSTNINLQHPMQNSIIQQPNNNIHSYPYQPIPLQHLQQQQIMPLPLQSQLYHQYPPPPYHFQLQQPNINSNLSNSNDNIKIKSSINQAENLKDKQDNISKSTLKLRRGPWSPEEDKRLLQLVEMSGGERNLNWVKISQMLESRTAKQARERYHQNLKPSLNRTPITAEEGKLIEELVERYGKRWAEIARHLNGRSDNAIKNWWNGGANRRKRATTQGITIKDYKDKDEIEMDHQMELESEKENEQEKVQMKETGQDRDQELENETQTTKGKEGGTELKIENGNKKIQVQQLPAKGLTSLPAPPHSHQQQDQRRTSLSTVYPPLIASSANNKSSFDVPLLPPLVDSNHHQFVHPHLHQLHSGRSASVDIRPSNSNSNSSSSGPNITTPNVINFDLSSIRKRKIFDDHLNGKPSRRHSAASINSASNFSMSSVSNSIQSNNNNTGTPGLYPGSPLSRLSSRNSSVGSSSDYATLHLTSGYTSDNNSINSRRSSLFAPPSNAFAMTMVYSNLNETPPSNVFKMKSPGIGPRLSITALNQYSISNGNNNNNNTVINSVQPHSNITNLNLDDNSNAGGAFKKDIFKKNFNLSNASTITKLSMENEVEPTIKKNAEKKSSKEEDDDEKKNEDKQKMSISFLV